MNKTATPVIHIRLFEELIYGRFRPFIPRFSNAKELKNLIREAQTCTVAEFDDERDVDDFIVNTDFLPYGFRSTSDYKLSVRKSERGSMILSLEPTLVYDGREVLDIPNYTSFKTNVFLETIMDEFERVKIRAEKKLEMEESYKALSVYAEKHIVKAKKLLYDLKQLMNENHNREDMYILLSLSMVLIHTIVFYQKMFKPFLSIVPDTADHLKAELFSSIALGRLRALFGLRDSKYCCYIKKSLLEDQELQECNCVEPVDGSPKTFSEKKSLPSERTQLSFYPAKWNGQLNVLMDIFIQMTEEIRVDGKPILETSPENLRAIIMEAFVDKDGKKLSYHTVNTNLKSYRTDKRINAKSQKKIDVASIISKPGKE